MSKARGFLSCTWEQKCDDSVLISPKGMISRAPAPAPADNCSPKNFGLCPHLRTRMQPGKLRVVKT